MEFTCLGELIVRHGLESGLGKEILIQTDYLVGYHSYNYNLWDCLGGLSVFAPISRLETAAEGAPGLLSADQVCTFP